MYLVHLKTALVDALRQTFTSDYPEEIMRGMYVSIEYPINKENYPSIWVDFENTGPLQIAGIGHTEVVQGDDYFKLLTRWRFAGYASFTVVALTSLERDRMYDELIRTIAFAGRDDSQISIFRELIEQNEFVAMNMDFDQIETRGSAAAPGTPWGSDEIIYERTVNMELIGEFVSDGASRELVSLSGFQVESIYANPDGSFDDPYVDYPGTTPGDHNDPTAWQ